jgi:hypothetical protein
MQHGSHPSQTDEQTLDTIFTLLGHRRRRDVVAVLSEREPSVSLHDVATAVRELKPEPESDGASARTTRDVAAALHHSHLPKLDRADVIDYDPETNAVTAIRTTKIASFVRQDGQ